MISIVTFRLIFTYPGEVNLSPRMKPYVSPLGFSPNRMKGVDKLMQPSRISTIFPPGSEFSHTKIFFCPSSFQTAID